MNYARAVGALLLLMTPGVCTEARAQEKPDLSAEQWAREGEALARSGQTSAAREQYERAYRATGSPGYGLWVARSLLREMQWVEAAERYAELTQGGRSADSGEESAQRAQAALEREQLLTRIPNVQVQIQGAPREEVKLAFNGRPVNASWFATQRPVDPGELHVVATYRGRRAEARKSLREGEQHVVTLRFPIPAVSLSAVDERRSAPLDPSLAPQPGGGQRVLGFVAMGVGGATLITGGVFGLLALGNQADLQQRCPAARCPAALQSDVDTYESNKTIAAVGLAAGAALAAGGVVLYLTAKGSSDAGAARVGLWYGGETWGARGEF